MGMGVLPIAHPVGAFGVVAFGDLPNPVRRIPRALGDVFRLLPTCEQPEDLPPTAFMRLFGRAIPALKILATEVGAQMNTSWHIRILQWPVKNWYEWLSSLFRKPCYRHSLVLLFASKIASKTR